MYFPRIVLISVFLCSFVLYAKPIPKTEKAAADIKSLLAQIQKSYIATSRFQAQFTQKYHHKILKKVEESQGQLYYQKPGKLRWDYNKPHLKSFIVDTNSLWILQPEDNLAYENKCFKQDALTASIAFLWGQGKITDVFQAEWFKGELGDKEDRHILLTPKKKNSIFKQLILVVDPKIYRIKQSVVVDLSGNMNQFIFTDAKYNQKAMPDTFKPKLPKTIKILPMPGSCGH